MRGGAIALGPFPRPWRPAAPCARRLMHRGRPRRRPASGRGRWSWCTLRGTRPRGEANSAEGGLRRAEGERTGRRGARVRCRNLEDPARQQWPPPRSRSHQRTRRRRRTEPLQPGRASLIALSHSRRVRSGVQQAAREVEVVHERQEVTREADSAAMAGRETVVKLRGWRRAR